jgi:hypothetical protein
MNDRQKTRQNHALKRGKYEGKLDRKIPLREQKQIGRKQSKKQNTAEIQARHKNAKIRGKIDRKIPRQKYENADRKISPKPTEQIPRRTKPAGECPHHHAI